MGTASTPQIAVQEFLARASGRPEVPVGAVKAFREVGIKVGEEHFK